MDDYPIFIDSHENFARLFINGWVVDGRDGGLVIGRRHSEGHILMLQGTDELGQFAFIGYMEGGEYIMSPEATVNHRERLIEINQDNAPCNTAPLMSPSSRILNTRAEPHDKLLIVQQQFIININSTNRHFAELDELNSRYRYHHGRVLNDEELEAIRSLP